MFLAALKIVKIGKKIDVFAKNVWTVMDLMIRQIVILLGNALSAVLTIVLLVIPMEHAENA